MKKASEYFSIGISIFVILIIFMLIIPLPPVILDFLFILQMGVSIVILISTLQIKKPLDFSVFPTLLLLATLFRLALNISSTRSILTHSGYAGKVIDIFGKFVTGGNIITGLVIFFIIVLVQFMVITKGTERISEVSARFTLDAMPGKQMAVDAELNSGSITKLEAREIRREIQRESAFFGSMDGASKFVKGDAVISVVITLINFIGGITTGFISGKNFSEIFNTYSAATIGDGLVSQIPALLLSVSAGIIITRSSSEEKFGMELLDNFSSRPGTMVISGVVLLLLLFTGFPPIQLLIVSLIFIGVGLFFIKGKMYSQTEGVLSVYDTKLEKDNENTEEKSECDLYTLLNIDPLRIDFGYNLISLFEEKPDGKNFLECIVDLRKEYAREMGIIIPTVRLGDNSNISPNKYSIYIRGEEAASGEIFTDYYLAIDSANCSIAIDGIETVDPVYGEKALWINSEQKNRASLLGYTIVEPVDVIITHFSEIIKANSHEILTREEICNMLNNLKKINPSIVDDTVPKIVSVSELKKIICKLLKEDIPVKDLEIILETIADNESCVGDIDLLAEHIRRSLKRTISHRFSYLGQMRVITLGINAENFLLEMCNENIINQNKPENQINIQKIINIAEEQVKYLIDEYQKAVILVPASIRSFFSSKMNVDILKNAVVLSFDEIENDIQVQSAGIIEI